MTLYFSFVLCLLLTAPSLLATEDSLGHDINYSLVEDYGSHPDLFFEGSCPPSPIALNEPLLDNLESSFELVRREFLEVTIQGRPPEKAAVKKHHPCPQCSRHFTSKKTLTNHQRARHRPHQHLCPYCPYTAALKESLKNHINSKHLNIFHHCPHCSYKANRKNTLKDHIDNIHSTQTYKCPQCPYVASSKQRLRSHKRKEHKR